MSSLLHNQKHVDLQNIPLLFVYVCLYSETKINEIHRSQGRTSWKNRNVMARLATLSYLESANGHKGCFFLKHGPHACFSTYNETDVSMYSFVQRQKKNTGHSNPRRAPSNRRHPATAPHTSAKVATTPPCYWK